MHNPQMASESLYKIFRVDFLKFLKIFFVRFF